MNAALETNGHKAARSMVTEHRGFIERMLDNIQTTQDQRDAILLNFDLAVGAVTIDYCNLRNKLSGLIAKYYPANAAEEAVAEAQLIEEMHQS